MGVRKPLDTSLIKEYEKNPALTLQERKQKFKKRCFPINKAVWNSKRKKLVHSFTQKGYIQPRLRKVFTDLKDGCCGTKEIKSVTKFVSRCLEKLNKGDYDIEENRSGDNFGLLVAGKTNRAVEVRQALFDFFYRCSLVP